MRSCRMRNRGHNALETLSNALPPSSNMLCSLTCKILVVAALCQRKWFLSKLLDVVDVAVVVVPGLLLVAMGWWC
jgi:hypothetical protein